MGGREDLRIHLDADDFIKETEPGDVILIANSTALSHLVRYGIHRPFSHAGLVHKKGWIRSAYPATADHPSPIHDDDLKELVKDSLGYGWHKFDQIALLRPTFDDADDDALDRVIAMSAELRDHAVEFHKADIFKIVVTLLCQAPYRLDDKLTGKADHKLFRHPMVRWSLRFAMRRAKPKDDPTSLICSEYVYRCFAHAGVEVPLPFPIVQLSRPSQVDAPGGVHPDSVVGTAMQANRLKRSGPMVSVDSEPPELPGGPAPIVNPLLDGWKRPPWRGIDKFLQRVQNRRDNTNEIDAEFVTPGDLVNSPRFRMVALYVRTAWPNDPPVVHGAPPTSPADAPAG